MEDVIELGVNTHTHTPGHHLNDFMSEIRF